MECDRFDLEAIQSSSLGIVGWAECEVLDWENFRAERDARQAREEQRTNNSQGSCCAFTSEGAKCTDMAEQEAQRHNETVVRLIEALGASGTGRRAILAAVAKTHGVTEEEDTEKMLRGESEGQAQRAQAHERRHAERWSG